MLPRPASRASRALVEVLRPGTGLAGAGVSAVPGAEGAFASEAGAGLDVRAGFPDGTGFSERAGFSVLAAFSEGAGLAGADVVAAAFAAWAGLVSRAEGAGCAGASRGAAGTGAAGSAFTGVPEALSAPALSAGVALSPTTALSVTLLTFSTLSAAIPPRHGSPSAGWFWKQVYACACHRLNRVFSAVPRYAEDLRTGLMCELRPEVFLSLTGRF